jgi:hypothetical protein
MCEACDNEYNNEEEEVNFLSDIPEHEKEEFLSFACAQFNNIIEKATEHNILYQLITDWERERQAAFTMACVMESRANSIAQTVLDDDEN